MKNIRHCLYIFVHSVFHFIPQALNSLLAIRITKTLKCLLLFSIQIIFNLVHIEESSLSLQACKDSLIVRPSLSLQTCKIFAIIWLLFTYCYFSKQMLSVLPKIRNQASLDSCYVLILQGNKVVGQMLYDDLVRRDLILLNLGGKGKKTEFSGVSKSKDNAVCQIRSTLGLAEIGMSSVLVLG